MNYSFTNHCEKKIKLWSILLQQGIKRFVERRKDLDIQQDYDNLNYSQILGKLSNQTVSITGDRGANEFCF